ncbi:MAG: STAS domain-containing protein [Phycisphaerae bacterium]|jgi:anti-anti-sigma factor|nr:STAS domain-containing protein [Phycisphaerae bacterium]
MPEVGMHEWYFLKLSEVVMPMTDTSAVFEDIQDVIVVRIQDQEISYHTGESIHSQMPAITEGQKPPKFILDLSKITFLGSIGLTVLVVFLKRVKTAGGQLVIVGLTGQCRNVMSVTRLDRAFDFYDDTDEAIAALNTN